MPRHDRPVHNGDEPDVARKRFPSDLTGLPDHLSIPRPMRELDRMHMHRKDLCVVFDDSKDEKGERRHDYWVDWHQNGQYSKDGLKSATTFIKQFFGGFDAEATVNMMKKNQKKHGWDGITQRFTKGAYKGDTVEDMLAKWEVNRVQASNAGTEMHAQFEAFYQKENHDNIPQTKEFDMFIRYHRGQIVGKAVPYRTEWIVWDPVTKICGSIDMIWVVGTREEVDPVTGEIIRILLFKEGDWKRSKSIKSFGFGGKKGFGPCANMADCNKNHYWLQACLYRYILQEHYRNFMYKGERYHRCEVVEMSIIVTHPNQDQYLEHKFQPRDNIIIDMMNYRLGELGKVPTNYVDGEKLVGLVKEWARKQKASFVVGNPGCARFFSKWLSAVHEAVADPTELDQAIAEITWDLFPEGTREKVMQASKDAFYNSHGTAPKD